MIDDAAETLSYSQRNNVKTALLTPYRSTLIGSEVWSDALASMGESK